MYKTLPLLSDWLTDSHSPLLGSEKGDPHGNRIPRGRSRGGKLVYYISSKNLTKYHSCYLLNMTIVNQNSTQLMSAPAPQVVKISRRIGLYVIHWCRTRTSLVYEWTDLANNARKWWVCGRTSLLIIAEYPTERTGTLLLCTLQQQIKLYCVNLY